MTKLHLLFAAACLIAIAEVSTAQAVPAATPPERTQSQPADNVFTLWQLPNQTPTQIMSYVLKTRGGKLIVLDGGMPGDAPYLATFLQERGNAVEAWFISHPHIDHMGALCEILKDPGDLKIGSIYGSLPDPAWIAEHAAGEQEARYTELMQALADAFHGVKALESGQELDIDGVKVEILGVKNPEIVRNCINNSSLVFKASDARKSILFTGDLGVEGGEKLLKSPQADRLHADYVQMGHHGQAGPNEAFYRHVGAKYCLWPTPLWLWDDDNGGGKGSGPWKTLEVRAWMEKLSIEKHYLMHEGLQRID